VQQVYVVTDERTVKLDEALPIKEGKVRVVVEVVEGSGKMSHEEFTAWLRQRQQARGHVPPTREEVDAYLKAERESWDD
jgi:hypothetical protein